MNRTLFYFSYAWRGIRRGGRWSTLAIFCIAAGVAAVVALRGLGLSIAASLVENVRIENRGDFRITVGDAFSAIPLLANDDERGFDLETINRVQEYADARGAKLSAFRAGGNLQIAALDAVTFGRPEFISTFIIYPFEYPPTHEIRAVDPPDVPLAQLFTDGFDVVISENMAQSQGLRLGDTVRVGGTEQPFTVRGIVRTSEEAGIRDLFAAFFGFAYLEFDDVYRSIGPDILPNTLAISYAEPLASLEEAWPLEQELRDTVLSGYWGLDFESAPDLLDRNQIISQFLGDFIVVMGLGALLIGGVGIMNTMLVMVRRRTDDIAAMKTFGLKGRQIAALFLAEGLILGLLGSVFGTILGTVLGGLVNRYGEAFLQQSLPWRIYPEAILYGVVLGLVITAIFSVAPILTALQVRPASILRPNETIVPRLGCLQTIGLMIVVTIAIGLVAGQIVAPSMLLPNERSGTEVLPSWSPYAAGVVGVAVTLAILGLLVLQLWVVVWLASKIPSFRSVSLRLALRNLSTNRMRTATTLLALSAGMFALSSITFIGQGTRELLNLQLAQQIGGNVLVFPIAPGAPVNLGRVAVNNALRNVEGIRYRTTYAVYNASLVAIDGIEVDINTSQRGLRNRMMNGDLGDDFNQQAAYFNWSTIGIYYTDNPNIYTQMDVRQGRQLTLEDRGQRYVVGAAQSAARLGIQVGSLLTYRIGNQDYVFEVIGLTGTESQTPFSMMSNAGVTASADSLPDLSPMFQFYTFDIGPENVNQALVELSTIRIPPTLALDITFVDSLISRVVDQFSAIPTVVGLLSLFAAAVIMANTVALATLERRRQIGVLKSIGLKGARVLRIMLLETTIIGLLSAILGIGLSSLFVALFTSWSGTPIPLPAESRLTALLLVLASVAIAWIATFLSANVALRERVMNVLRYE